MKEIRLKDCFINRGENINDNFQGEILYVDIGSVSYREGIINKELIKFEDAPSRARKIVNHNDIIISTVRTYLKSIVKIENPEPNLIVSTGFSVLKPKNNYFPTFLEYALKNDELHNDITQKSKGVSYPSINNHELLSISFLCPNLSQQTAIANYLDYHTSKIDKEISLLEQKVEKLDEYKQALIYETATKGLDKNVPMKDSGIEWIGQIPEHWEVKRVSDFFNSPKIITNPGRSDVLSLTLNGVIEKDIESNKGLNPDSYDTYQVFKKNDLVFKLIDLANYQTSRVGRVWKDGIMSSAYIRLAKKKHTNVDYFFYQFFDLYKRAIFNMLGGNGVRSAINRGDLLKLSIVVPTQTEQQEIVTFLEQEYKNIDNKKELINKKIGLFEEYKQSLIYESVTGKMEIL